MSVTPHTQDTESHEYECGHCGGSHRPAETVAGAFCSIECHTAHRREKRVSDAMRELEQDHRFCATCGRQLKELEEPTESYEVVIGPCAHADEWDNVSDVLIGYQHRTPHAETGWISLDVDDEADRPIVEDGVAVGTVCTCGNTSHRHESETLRDRFPFTAAHYLERSVTALRIEEKHDVELDRDRLFDAVLERESIRSALEQAVILDD